MRNQQWLSVGTSTLIAGTVAGALLSFSLPSARPIAIAIGGTAGAIGSTVVTSSKKSRSTQLESEKKLRREVVNSLGTIERLLVKNKTELQQNFNTEITALQKQINSLNNHLEKSTKLESEQKFNDQITDFLDRIEDSLTENKTGLTILKAQVNLVEKRINKLSSPSPVRYDLPESEPSQANASIVEESEEASESESKNLAIIIDWLERQNFTVEGYKEREKSDYIFNEVAMILGQQYRSLKPFYRRIKYRISKGGRISHRFSDKHTMENMDRIRGFCKLLDDRSFLPCRYLSKQKMITAEPPANPHMINFFNGDWFELFVYQQICNLFDQQGIEYTSLTQVAGTLENGRDFELDIVFMINEQILWIECKSGQDYNKYLQRYTKLRERMKLPKERAFLVIADLSIKQAAEYTSLWEITVSSIDNFIELISNALGLNSNNELPQSENTKEKITEIQTVVRDKLFKLLDKKSLRPYPEYRKTIINELVKIFSNLEQPITINQIKDNLKENLQIAKRITNDIIRALMRSECLLDSTGEPIASYSTPVSSLISLDSETLESKCMETYTSVALDLDPNYFDDPSNRKEFEETTGGEIPTKETIERLLNR